MPNGRIHRTCICEKSAEAQIRVYNGKQNCARLDLAIAQEAYTGNWTLPLFGPLICTWIENELSEFSVITTDNEHAVHTRGASLQQQRRLKPRTERHTIRTR